MSQEYKSEENQIKPNIINIDIQEGYFFHGYDISNEKYEGKEIDIIKIFNTYRDYIKHQYDLLNHRTTWFLGINAFLFGAFGLTIQKRIEVLQSFTIKGDAVNCVAMAEIVMPLDILVIGITIIGFVMNFICRRLLRAASKPIVQMYDLFQRMAHNREIILSSKEANFDIGNKFVLPFVVGGLQKKNMQIGRRLTARIPVLFIVLWAALRLRLILFVYISCKN